MTQDPTPVRDWAWFPLPRTDEGWKWLGGLYLVGALAVCAIGQPIMGAPDTKSPDYDAWIDKNAGWLWLAGLTLPLVPVIGFWLLRLLFYGALGLHSLWRERAERKRKREEQRRLLLTERVNALHTKMRQNQASLRAMAKETQDVAVELEEYLRGRLAFLDDLTSEVQQKEELSKLTPEMLVAFEKALRIHFGNERRSGLRNQFIFLVLAFALGFVVNWLSNPALETLNRWLGR